VTGYNVRREQPPLFSERLEGQGERIADEVLRDLKERMEAESSACATPAH